jgi:hypothetical protein
MPKRHKGMAGIQGNPYQRRDLAGRPEHAAQDCRDIDLPVRLQTDKRRRRKIAFRRIADRPDDGHRHSGVRTEPRHLGAFQIDRNGTRSFV